MPESTQGKPGAVSPQAGGPPRVAFLVNRYPFQTHSFIRREIQGLEALGMPILRISLRPIAPEDLVEPRDREEQVLTTALLGRGLPRLFWDAFLVFLTRPWRWLRVLWAAVRWGIGSYSGLFRHLAYFVEACSLLRLLQRHRIQHVHVHFGTNPSMVALLMRRLGGPSYSMMIHGPEEFEHARMLHLREKVQEAAFVAAITSYCRSQLFRWSDPEQWSKVHLVRCGVDESFFEGEAGPVPDTTQVVCVGRVGSEKGQWLLFEAARTLHRKGRDLRLVLIGDGRYLPRIKERVRAAGMEDLVQTLGWQGQDVIRKTLTESRALVLPSFAEGLPVVIMEALAMGRPVVTTTITGIPELVEDGVNGWLVRAGDQEDLERALEELLDTTPDQLTRMGRAGREMVRERHDARGQAAVLKGLLEQVLAGEGVGPRP